ncbi:protein PYRICULARIA ORYZAE RESISTANCE 21-like [Salvia splendens]|uniref:protein PYRICULARIA ORYZAE RESISTANCE 21-like n=1 Tax=Salvia splendens TaxID=180675 RepID=UPI001C267A24|nr:protein PYRICULARIA ORYZAE RESISTANCE 21-like [Salvia splendens]
MATENLTIMTLNVDLQCPRCYNKLRKILCNIPQVRDRVYDMNKNQVMITVDGCNPEKIRDKLCSKGRNVIKSIII